MTEPKALLLEPLTELVDSSEDVEQTVYVDDVRRPLLEAYMRLPLTLPLLADNLLVLLNSFAWRSLLKPQLLLPTFLSRGLSLPACIPPPCRMLSKQPLETSGCN